MRVARRHDERGSITETVLVAPALVLILALVLQVVLWANATQVAKAAAREGARAARVDGGTVDAGDEMARRFAAQAGSGSLVDVTVDGHRSADTATVVVRGRAPRILPFLDLQVTASSSGPVERFRPEGDRR